MGWSLHLSLEEGSPYKSLLALGAILFKRGDFKLKAKTLDDRARWLLGAAADAEFERLDAEKTRLPLRQAFPEGGYFVLGCEFDTPSEIRVVADAGPLGYRSIAAHGHADALSFTLSAGGREFLIDPGTYAYHTQERWRQYFRGTAAHNTLRIDGLDQSVSGGNFMWLRKARAGCSLWLSSTDAGQLRGLARRLHAAGGSDQAPAPDPAAQESAPGGDRGHARDGRGPRRRALLPLQRALPRGPRAGRLRSSARASIALRIILPAIEGASSTVQHGSLAPIMGWVSRAFDRREPTSTIVWRARLAGNSLLRTEIFIDELRSAGT